MHKCEGCGQKCLCDGEEYDWYAAPDDCQCDHSEIRKQALIATAGFIRADRESRAATDRRYSILIAAAQSALGFMEGIVYENLASQKFVKDSARQQIQQLRDALYAAYRCGYCNDKIVRATVGSGYVHVKSGLRACIEQRVHDPSSPNATPER